MLACQWQLNLSSVRCPWSLPRRLCSRYNLHRQRLITPPRLCERPHDGSLKPPHDAVMSFIRQAAPVRIDVHRVHQASSALTPGSVEPLPSRSCMNTRPSRRRQQWRMHPLVQVASVSKLPRVEMALINRPALPTSIRFASNLPRSPRTPHLFDSACTMSSDEGGRAAAIVDLYSIVYVCLPSRSS